MYSGNGKISQDISKAARFKILEEVQLEGNT